MSLGRSVVNGTLITLRAVRRPSARRPFWPAPDAWWSRLGLLWGAGDCLDRQSDWDPNYWWDSAVGVGEGLWWAGMECAQLMGGASTCGQARKQEQRHSAAGR